MVSSEGACAAYYKYGRLSTIAKRTIAQKPKFTLTQEPLPACGFSSD